MMESIISKVIRYIEKLRSKRTFREVNSNLSKISVGSEHTTNLRIKHRKNLIIGNYTALNGDLYINAFGEVEIGIFCHIAKGLTIYSHNHNWKPTKKIPYDEVNIRPPVLIGDPVWIGANVTLTPGVKLGKGVIVAAGAVVFGEIPDCAIIKGSPAKVVKFRDKVLFDKLYNEGQFA